MQNTPLHLTILEGSVGICRFDARTPVPEWVYRSSFYSVTRTQEEMSVVCYEDVIPQDILCEKGWRCLKVRGPIDFSEIGILCSLTKPLARESVSVFVLSTYDTDYLFVREKDLSQTIRALALEGFSICSDIDL